jgi:pimeloyl-ACP methyl ester carboxylesterase
MTTPTTTPTTATKTTDPITTTLEVPGATLTYDVRPNAETSEPPLLLIASPMGASGLRTLAGFFPDRTVVTYDPRGVDRSVKVDPATESTPQQHADDLHAIVAALGAGPVDLFASSGGAINGLALVERYPEDVRTLVAHEPPAVAFIPDREAAIAATRNIGETYQRAGFGPAMAKFILLVSHDGLVPADLFAGPDPDPGMFHLPSEDDGSRTDPLLFQNITTSTQYPVNIAALKEATTRVVVAVGEESGSTLARRGGEAIAERLGTDPVVFPSGHGGFLGNEYGQPGKPEEFAAALRTVLAGDEPHR